MNFNRWAGRPYVFVVEGFEVRLVKRYRSGYTVFTTDGAEIGAVDVRHPTASQKVFVAIVSAEELPVRSSLREAVADTVSKFRSREV